MILSQQLIYHLTTTYNASIENLLPDAEAQEYDGGSFTLASQHFIYRKAKITPKKLGHFVTLWQRNSQGITTPYNNLFTVDNVIIAVEQDAHIGYFLFSKDVVLAQGIFSTPKKEGKRGFRLYAPWLMPDSLQARKTQQWQTKYFVGLDTIS